MKWKGKWEGEEGRQSGQGVWKGTEGEGMKGKEKALGSREMEKAKKEKEKGGVRRGRKNEEERGRKRCI